MSSSLLSHLSRVWHLVGRIGTGSCPDAGFRKRIQLTNWIAFCLSMVVVPFMVRDILLGAWQVLVMNLIWAGFFAVLIMLNRFGFFFLSRWAMLLFLNLFVLAGVSMVGAKAGTQLAYFVIICLPLILFELSNRLSIALFIVLPAICYILIEWPGSPFFNPPTVPPSIGTYAWVVEAFIVMFMLVLIVYLFRASNEKSEQDLARLVAEREEALERLSRQQELMIQTSKMSALGEMAGGIAHEINTPLAVIQLRTSQIQLLARRNQLSQEAIGSPLSVIQETVERIAKIIQGLRSFAREAQTDPLELRSVRSLVDTTLDLCIERFKSHGVRVEWEQIPENLMVNCRPIQIAQVLINLLNNSFDAVESQKEAWVRIEAEARGEDVVISVVDSGPGIPQEVRQKIFQPFFTTKGIGKGTGLGLSISKGIIESHSGALGFDYGSRNTKAVLTLPKAEAH